MGDAAADDGRDFEADFDATGVDGGVDELPLFAAAACVAFVVADAGEAAAAAFFEAGERTTLSMADAAVESTILCTVNFFIIELS